MNECLHHSQVLGKMQVTGVDANVVTFNSLMTIIAKSAAAGDIPDAGAALSQGTQVSFLRQRCNFISGKPIRPPLAFSHKQRSRG